MGWGSRDHSVQLPGFNDRETEAQKGKASGESREQVSSPSLSSPRTVYSVPEGYSPATP